MTVIDCGLCALRPREERDIEALPAIAGDADVARYLRDRFAHPYTIDDARQWVALNREMRLPTRGHHAASRHERR
jgi:RimJ/RimL family protein N-acetyltransferase